MNNLIIRTKEQELILEIPGTYYEFVDLINKPNAIQNLINKYKKIDKLTDAALQTCVIELVDNTISLTVFNKVNWTGDNILDWKRNYHMIWNLKKN